MFDAEHFPALFEEQPKSAQDFFQNSQDSIYHRVVYWIKSKKPEKLSIEGLELLKAPDWAYLLKQAIKRNSKEVISSILPKSGKIIRENEASKILILQTAYFFQEKFDPEIIKLLAKQEIALKDEQNFDIGNSYTWEKMKNDGSIFAYDEIGQTVSHYAASRGEKKFFEWLAEKENSIIFKKLMTTKSKQGDQNPLHIAVQCCSDNIIELIISKYNQNLWIKEAIQSEINLKGEIILFLAAKWGNLTIFKRIFEFCQNMSNQKLIFNKKGFSIENICCQLSRSEIIKYLQHLGSYSFELSPENQILALKNSKIIVNVQVSLWVKPLPDHKYCISKKQGNFLEKCSLLNCTANQGNLNLHKEFFANYQDKFETKTQGKLRQITDDFACNSLQAATKKGHFHIVYYLISKKLYMKNWQVNEKNKKQTALEIAQENGHRDIEYLLQHSIACTSILENNNEDQLNWKEIKKIPRYLERVGSQGTLLDCSIKTKNLRLVQKIIGKTALQVNIQDSDGKTPLFYCIDNRDIEIFKLLITNGASPFIMDNSNMTPLILLIKYGLYDLIGNIFELIGQQFGIIPGINPVLQALQCKEFEIANKLSKYLPGAIKNQKDILFYSVEKNYLSMIEFLIKKGISGNKLDLQNIQFETPLLLALTKRNEEIVNILLDNSASVKIQNLKNETALNLAIQNNCSSKIIEKILQIEDKCKFTSIEVPNLLSYTIRQNNQEQFDLLLKYKTSINLQGKFDVGHPVYQAIFEENEYFLCTLLKKDPNICKMLTEKKRNLLSLLAESKKHIKRKLKLIESQIAFEWFRDQLDIADQSPLFLAVKYNNIAMVRFLFEKGARFIYFPQYFEENLITQAILQGNFDIVELYLQYNFDVNLQNIKGETALIKAIVQNNEKMVKFLLEKRPNIEINKPNFQEETPILIVIQRKNIEIIKTLLLNKEINLNIADKKNNYPLLCLPFEDLEATFAILKMIYPFKNTIDFLVSDNNENILLKALKMSTGIMGDQKKKILFQKIIKILMKLGFSKNLSSKALNKQDQELQTAVDIALNNRDLFRISKFLMFSGCNGKKSQLASRKRLLMVIQLMIARMISISQLRRKEKKWENLFEIEIIF